MLLTGCRSGEVASLQCSDVKDNRLRLRNSKTGPRTVWLGDEALAVIAALPRQRNVAWPFWNPTLHKPVPPLGNHWRAICDRAGLAGVRLHDLRHTFASHAAMNKDTLPMIGRLLGHLNTQSTSRYALLVDEHGLRTAERIGAAVQRILT
ncbi:site-specific integrase [Sphingomonas sp. Leaf38]|uniref:site-specific integrase n=1 Tax=Sphingomonas sp. Leaf38 TaxID=1736217 RepID=UPI00138F0C41|nr:site-specific integrase [Sphingomonas sp. Leaf38]